MYKYLEKDKLNKDKIESIEVKERIRGEDKFEEIIVTTKKLYYKGNSRRKRLFSRKKYLLGRFRINIPMTISGMTEIYNLDYDIAHPCIHNGESICWGPNIQIMLAELKKYKRPKEIIYLIINWLEEPDYSTPYRTITSLILNRNKL